MDLWTLFGGACLAATACLSVATLVAGAERPRLRERAPVLLGPGDPCRGLELLEPPDLDALPRDTRGLGLWAHPLTGDTLLCLACRDGWLLLWRAPHVLIWGQACEVVMAECRCGLIWRVSGAWHRVGAWAPHLPADRRPRPWTPSVRARHLVGQIHAAGRYGEPVPWWWPHWPVSYDEGRHVYVCPRCRVPEPNRLYEGEQDRCGGCGRPWHRVWDQRYPPPAAWTLARFRSRLARLGTSVPAAWRRRRGGR